MWGECMRIGQFYEYRGYVGTIEYYSEENLYHGKLLFLNGDFVNYEANNIVELWKNYRKAIDDYIEFKKEMDKV